MSLSSRIVQRGVATIREVEEALARQVLYGGDLVTNLLEVSRIDEGVLMPIVAEELGLPVAPTGELPRASDEAQRMVAAEVARERGMAPLSMDRYGLVVAVAEPLDKEAEQELTFALAVPIAQQVAPLVRIRQALARDYGLPLERRLERLLQKMADGGPRTQSSFPPQRIPDVKQPPRPPSVMPPPLVRAVPEPPERSPGTPETLLRVAEPAAPRRSRRRRGPLTLDVATAELEQATERDTIFDLLFEFARQFFDYTAIFIVHNDVAEGRDAYGDGAPRERVSRLGVPLDLPGLLASARNDKKLARGAGDPSGVDGVLKKDLDRPLHGECVVLPVIVRTRVVALVLGDGGEGGVDDGGLRDVEAITSVAAAAFERLIVRRKLGGSMPPPERARTSRPPRPAVEELAAPIRDLVAETSPASLATKTQRQPTPEVTLPLSSTLSERPVPPGSDTGPPPPTNLLAVRKPSGRPIPREEPEPAQLGAGASSASPPPRSRSSGSMRRAKAPPFEFAAQPVPSSVFGAPIAEGATERRLLAEIQGHPSSAPMTTRDTAPPAFTPMPPPVQPIEPVESIPPASPKAESPPPPPPRPKSVTDVSPVGPVLPAPARTLTIIDDDDEPSPAPPTPLEGDATPAAPAVSAAPSTPARVTSSLQSSPVAPSSSQRPMPQSEQMISVAPHRPPLSRSDSARGLPSVIVDVSSEYVAFVERVIAGEDDEAEGGLLRGGGQAMPAIMARFPGPLTVDPARLEKGPLPRVAECGPVLRLVASQRRIALPYVLSLVTDDDTDKRFWATFLLSELVYPDAVDAAIARVFDDEGRVRRAARAAVRAMAEAHPEMVTEQLQAVAQDTSAPANERMLAIDTLGETREALAVAALVPVIEDESSEIVAAARGALTTVTRQDFGANAEKWKAWWEKNRERHRIEWLIDALVHDKAPLRAAAGEELKTITKEFFGYHDDLPKRERERAQSRYREWWNNIGRVRFNRASMRGN